MLATLARVVIRHRRLVLIGALLFLITGGLSASSGLKGLSQAGLDVSGSESAQAARTVRKVFGAGSPNVVLLLAAKQGKVDDPAIVKIGTEVTARLNRENGVAEAFSYWGLGSAPPLRSRDGKQALIAAHLDGDAAQLHERAKRIGERLSRDDAVVSVRLGGLVEVSRETRDQIETDVRRAEVIVFPLTLVLLVLVFRSVIAAVLPLVIGVLAILGTLLVLAGLSRVTEVSTLALNITTALSLGLAIDYSLLIVARYREELASGLSTDEAIVRTQATAGRTVLVSAVVVSASLSALLLFPISLLRSFAYAGVAVVAMAAVGALVVLPALLAVIGPRIDRWTVFQRPVPSGHSWYRVAHFVMRRPVPVIVVAIGFLLILAAPFARVQFGLPDDRALPKSAPARRVHEEIRTNFSSKEIGALTVIGTRRDPAQRDAVDSYATRLSKMSSVARVDSAFGSYVRGVRIPPSGPAYDQFSSRRGTWLSVVPAVEPLSHDGEALVRTLRAQPTPFGPVLVGGTAAQLVDVKAAMFERLPFAGALIAASTFILLFMVFGSFVVPFKALILNLLSLTATFGAMVWVFQEGHLAGLLGFTATGTIDTSTPVVMFCIAFGLSMDYEVFLLSRMKEEYDRSRDNNEAVAVGLATTGRLVTTAATLLAVVFIALAASGIAFVKLLAIGLTLAIVMDATLIRVALLPAVMSMMGDANWWAPRWARTLRRPFTIQTSKA